MELMQSAELRRTNIFANNYMTATDADAKEAVLSAKMAELAVDSKLASFQGKNCKKKVVVDEAEIQAMAEETKCILKVMKGGGMLASILRAYSELGHIIEGLKLRES